MTRHFPNNNFYRFFLFLFLGFILPSTQAQLRGSNAQPVKTQNIALSTHIPSLHETLELAHLSAMVYYFRHANPSNCTSFPAIYQQYLNNHHTAIFTGGTFTCHIYERDAQDTQVLILSKESHKHQSYIAIIYAGTDDFRTALTDTDILLKPFGPVVNGTYPLIPDPNIKVHAGFNNAVFTNGLYDRVKDVVNNVHQNGYKIYTTGHSLGAADAILTAIALNIEHQYEIQTITFGCPKTGNTYWREFVNSRSSVGIYRVVNGLDLVPRLPGIRFHHVGHTLQLDSHDAKAYWLHNGNLELGFKGVPFGWNTLPFALAPAAAIEHMMSHYIRYLEERSVKDWDIFYFHKFETIDNETQADDDLGPDGMDDDIWNSLPDDDYEHAHDEVMIAEVSALYLQFMQQEYRLQGNEISSMPLLDDGTSSFE